MKVKPSQKSGHVVMEVNEKDDRLMQQSATNKGDQLSLKKILVPTDFSEASENAFRYALQFARQFGAVISLLHVAEFHYGPLEGVEGIDINVIKKRLKEESHRRLEAFTRNGPPVPIQCETVVRIGRPSHEIIRMAKEEDIDLIIISSHGRTGWKHVLMGGTTENVVRLAPCPVLTVREHEHEFIPS